MILNNVKAFDQSGYEIPIKFSDSQMKILKEDVPENTQTVTFNIPFLIAQTGDEGYFVLADASTRGSHQCFFGEKEDFDAYYKQNLMPIFGVKREEDTLLFVVSGMQFTFYVNIGVKGGTHFFKPCFELNGDKPYEDIAIDFYQLGKDAGYVEMGLKYRQIQLENGCVPLKERCKNNPYLEYATQSVEIRIRMGWKPAPPEILFQTEENEPEMKVACTFKRVKDLIDELKKQGVEKAELCLVGWNKSGHDGRYPDLFPVEEKLGGEEDLKDLISYGQKMGYQIVCHTNSTDCYTISKDFSEDIVLKDKENNLCSNLKNYSGGKMYHLCPKFGLEFAKRDLPKVADLGFKGLHYVDVITTVPPRTCYDKNHPFTAKESVEHFGEIMELCREKFGGFASEGCHDFAAKHLDYGYYVIWQYTTRPFFDREIPLWQIVYHGIIMSNPCTATTNYTIKADREKARVLEYGGRPTFYINSKFFNRGDDQVDWLGKEDLLIDTDEQLKFTVSKIKEGYDDLTKYQNLQKEFIVNHQYITDTKRKTTYSDGTEIMVDYSEN